MKIIPLVLCGGSGTRLWPLSRELFPKQFINLLQPQESMLQTTLKRLSPLQHIDPPYIICNDQHRFLVAEQIRATNQKGTIILEPCSKNTAPAIAIAAFKAIQADKEAILIVLPADHLMDIQPEFYHQLEHAIQIASQNMIVTFGIKPTKPETGYGYIQKGAQYKDSRGFHVAKFIEKPSLDKAMDYCHSEQYLWNSGMFVLKARHYLNLLQQHASEIYTYSLASYESAINDHDFIRLDPSYFALSPSNSIDYAILEKTSEVAVIPLECTWSDVGTWSSLWEIHPQDENKNVLIGDVIAEDVQNSLIRSDHRLVVSLGLKNVVIVETPDAILVADKNQSSQLKDLVQQLKLKEREEVTTHRKHYRPWGSYETLIESPHFKVKHIIVNPGASLSLQMHNHRAEHWVVVDGIAEVTCDQKTFRLEKNQSTYIPFQTKHRLHNPCNTVLELIEVQSGTYLGEDDIVRFEDRYGRVEAEHTSLDEALES